MKAAVVHGSAAAVERDWAKQFVGLDPDVKSQFSAVDWCVRVPRVFTIPNFTWAGIVATVTSAAQAAGAGGVVIIVSGHGGAAFDNAGEGGLINWDPTDTVDVDRDWTREKIHKGLFWDDPVVRYIDRIPMGNPPNLKGEDERDIANKVKDFDILQKRHDAFEALQNIGNALKTSGVARLSFTSCTTGVAQAFMRRLAKLCQVEVAAFNQETMVLDDHTFGLSPGKARMIMETDKAQDGLRTNRLAARVFTPSLDDPKIAFVAQP